MHAWHTRPMPPASRYQITQDKNLHFITVLQRYYLVYSLPGMTASMICLTPGAVTIMPTMGRPASLGMSIRACGREHVY